MNTKYETLVQKMEEIPKIVSPDKLKDAEKIVFEEFIEKNFLEGEVAIGEKSFMNIIKLIDEKYDSMKKRMFQPKINEKFDIYVIGFVQSLSAVGLYKLDHSVYTTKGRKKKMQNLDKLALGGGLTASAVNTYFSFNSSKDNNAKEAKIPTWVKTALSVSLAIIPYVACKKLHNDQMNQALDILEDVAIQSDKYLRSLFFKYK